METNDSAEYNGCIDDNEQLNIEIIQPTADPLELSFNIEENYGLKPCFVELSRCDNIWKTLQLIRDLQDDGVSEHSNNNDDDDVDKHDEDEPASSINDNESYSSSTQANTMAPYIKYQPVLNNGNTALNFKFSVMSTRLLYQCHECGKQYSHRSTLREHSERVHNIILPIIRKKSENTNNDSSKNHQAKPNNCIQENNDVDSSELSISSEINVTDLQDDGALLDNISDTQLSDRESSIVSNKIYICHYCSRQYKDKYYFNHHLRTVHGTSIKGIRPYKKRNNNFNNNNTVNEQGTSKKVRRVQQNEQSRDLNVHQCSTCGRHFYDKVRLASHQRKIHGIFKRNTGVTRRFQTNKSNFKSKTHQSTTKSSKSSSASSLRQINEAIEEDRKINPCMFCEKTYIDRQSWKSHLIKVHDVKFKQMYRIPRNPETGPMSCKECGRQYLSNRGLADHLFTVHGQQPHRECETCGLKFPNSDSLIKHALEIHRIMLVQRIISRQNARPHKCHVCFTHYGKKRNLEWHMLEAHGKKNVDGLKAPVQTKNIPSTTMEQCALRRRSAPQKNLRKGLRDKTRINYNEAAEPHSVEQLLLGDALRNKENVETMEKNESGNVVLCFLCQRRCIKIHRHFTEYHKIRHPEALIAQCKPLSSSSEIDDNSVKNEVTTKAKIHVKNEHSRRVTKGRRDIDPNRLFAKMVTNTGHKYYKCKICPNYIRDSYEVLRKHEKIHKRQQVPLPLEKKEIDDYEQIFNSRKRKRVSTSKRKVQRPRLSESIEHTRTTRATTKLKETREFRCTVCERLFRNAEILSSHKISCMTYHAENSLMNDISDTRESSDRDSGIGISITIKKKNNSYEIVSRDGNEDEKLPNSDVINHDNLKISDVVSDNSSDTFAIMANNKNNDSEKSFSYSKHHRVLKIQKVEDIDVDIDLDSMSNSPINFQCENNQEVTSSVDDKMYQVPSLKQLCENFLKTIKKKDNLPFKCRICSRGWPSQAACNSHMRVHSGSF
ncbi:hypothetical protein PV326_008178 [Microctonus aethiopoides]|nr:hypothetical protein PV326_008178 [Microctonus aethiopoides]